MVVFFVWFLMDLNLRQRQDSMQTDFFFLCVWHDARRLYTAHNDRGHFNPQSEVSVCFVYAVSPPPQDVEEN